MKNIKISLKKLSLPHHRQSTASSRASIDSQVNEVCTDIESKRYFYRDCVHKITHYKNYEFPEDQIHPRVLEAIEDLEIREDDIVLMSYPASNAHLLEDLVRLMVSQDELKKAKLLNKRDRVESIPVARLEVANPYGHIRWLKSLKSPRILASHLPYDLLPKHVQNPVGKVIYLTRNPKDHIVAYYYHHRLKGIQLSLDDFIELYLNGMLLFGSYWDHVISYWQLAKLNPGHVLFVTYEELKILPLEMAKVISRFLELSLTEEELENILAQKNVMTERNMVSNNDSTISNKHHSSKINKFQGVLGDWANYFNPDQARRIDDMIRFKFESQNLNLPCDLVMATRLADKYGRLIPEPTGQASTIINIENMHARTSFRKKPVFTKEEALFIRQKDKVVIIEDDAPDEIVDGRENFCSRFLRHLSQYLCCCCPMKKNYYYKF